MRYQHILTGVILEPSSDVAAASLDADDNYILLPDKAVKPAAKRAKKPENGSQTEG